MQKHKLAEELNSGLRSGCHRGMKHHAGHEAGSVLPDAVSTLEGQPPMHEPLEGVSPYTSSQEARMIDTYTLLHYHPTGGMDDSLDNAPWHSSDPYPNWLWMLALRQFVGMI